MLTLYRKRPSRPVGAILATYTSPNFIRRHRVVLTIGLIFLALFYGAAFGLTTTYFLMQLSLPLLLVALVCIGLLPDVDNPPVGGLRKLLFAFIVGLLLWPDYLAIALPGLPWITVVRLIGVPLAIVLLMCLSVSSDLRRDLSETLATTPWVWRSLLTFFALAMLSIAWSSDPTISLNKFIVAAVNWFLIFVVSAYVFRTPGTVMRFAFLLCVIGVIVSLIGVQEWRHSVVPWAGHIPSFLKIEDENVQRILSGASRAGKGIYRVQSKFTTSLGLAEFYALLCPFVIHFAFFAKRKTFRIAALLSIPCLFKMIALTDSRLGMVGFFFSLLFYTLLWGAWRWKRDRDSMFGPLLTLSFPALFVGFLIASCFVGRLRALIWGDGSQQASTDSRKLQVATGIPKVVSHPWGYGFGRGGDALGFTNGAGVLTIDTYYLAVALEVGVIGFVVYYLIFLNATWNMARHAIRARTPEEMLLGPLAIAFVNFLVIKSIFSQLENHALVFAMLGAGVALCWRVNQKEPESPRRDVSA